MTTSCVRRPALTGALIALAIGGSAAADPTAAPAADTGAGQPILELRPRFEDVHQSGFAKAASGLTLRTHLGWRTGAWNGLSALVEVSDVHAIGAESYNTTVNGKTTYPVIADPDQVRLNRAQLTWVASPWLTATVGRQRILIDDQRFVGNADWRQNEQVFDAGRADVSLGKAKATYIYIGHVSRVFGDRLDWTGHANLVNASYAVAEPLKLEAFYYQLDFTTPTAAARAASTATTGAKLTGAVKVAPIRFAYGATYAEETNSGANLHHFRLAYTEADLSAAAGIFSLKAMYERLQGNGVVGFATPLATLHGFQGWADVFLTTPTKGIDDAYLIATAKPKFAIPYLTNTQFAVRYHDFKYDQAHASLGSEWDLQAADQITKRLSAQLTYADYRGVAAYASRTKVWVGLEYKY
jgi:hypothetical protein